MIPTLGSGCLKPIVSAFTLRIIMRPGFIREWCTLLQVLSFRTCNVSPTQAESRLPEMPLRRQFHQRHTTSLYAHSRDKRRLMNMTSILHHLPIPTPNSCPYVPENSCCRMLARSSGTPGGPLPLCMNPSPALSSFTASSIFPPLFS